jgi:hypothetical protein
MADSDQEVPWEVHLTTASYNFGVRCRELHDTNPYGEALAPTLQSIMTHLATELWDQCFSQSEIIAAFKKAIEGLPPYAAGEERRGDRDTSR